MSQIGKDQIGRFELLGYEFLGEAGVQGRLAFRKRSTVSYNLALVEYGGILWKNNILLRDYLRNNSGEVRAYGKHKEWLLGQGHNRLLDYSDKKAEFVASLLARARPYDVILFDLGGVLIELTGVAQMLEWLGPSMTEEELWNRWLTSDAVRQFEMGRIGADQFATSIVTEFQLPVSFGHFLKEFTAWPKALYPGGTDLLRMLASDYKLACLTNTNELHWPRVCNEMGLLPYFSVHFASHQLGLIKPDSSIFEHVLKELDCLPERILYLDDNQLCVDSASAVGLDARRVKGIEAVIYLLKDLCLIPVA